jgi:hypothetical protein
VEQSPLPSIETLCVIARPFGATQVEQYELDFPGTDMELAGRGDLAAQVRIETRIRAFYQALANGTPLPQGVRHVGQHDDA